MLQQYFCQYLIGQRNLSPQTVSAYRDTFKLLIRFLEQRRRMKSESLCVADLDAPNILKFLEDLERRRGNGPRTRNARLAAIRSFIRYAASAEPLLLPVAQRLLAIPVKRFDHPFVGYLTKEQIQSLLDAPNTSSRIGLRDTVLLMLMYNTGARVSEITALRVGNLRLPDARKGKDRPDLSPGRTALGANYRGPHPEGETSTQARCHPATAQEGTYRHLEVSKPSVDGRSDCRAHRLRVLGCFEPVGNGISLSFGFAPASRQPKNRWTSAALS